MKKLTLLFIFIIPFLVFLQLPAEVGGTFPCIAVMDGDSIQILAGSEKKRVRLVYIDAPELKQLSLTEKAIGEQAQKYLSSKILHKKIKIADKGRDKYNRMLAVVYLEKENINQSILAEGFGIPLFLQPISLSEKKKYQRAFQNAYHTKKGIWGQGGMINPYFWRKKQKKTLRK